MDSQRQPRRSGAGRSGSDARKGDLSSAAIAAERLGSALDRPYAKSARPARKTPAASRWRFVARLRGIRPVKALTTAVFSAALVGIVANAVLFQKSRNPAASPDVPHGAIAAVPAAPARARAPGDAAPTGAVSAPPAQVASAPAPAAAPPTGSIDSAPVHRHAPLKRTAAKPDGGDAIGQLLGGQAAAGDKTGPKAADAKPAAAEPDPTLLRTQRQLKKLGYAVTPDGRMDGGTRQAIKRFAHDHHVKAEAELTPALKREIADASSTAPKPGTSAADPAQPKAR